MVGWPASLVTAASYPPSPAKRSNHSKVGCASYRCLDCQSAWRSSAGYRCLDYQSAWRIQADGGPARGGKPGNPGQRWTVTCRHALKPKPTVVPHGESFSAPGWSAPQPTCFRT
ncbi:hypothetical protein Asi02nite_22520 [Asanoa siamensis]|uniref:Uncharacterized protein n=1 Tax=Asanoa siamensis TaxID=926357 RepID=A0ABQ4CN74_9ACTN|nr:hypothetical protein Asi02nite_22520 [Asanoa siamensis]